jgi:hypothetical protein
MLVPAVANADRTQITDLAVKSGFRRYTTGQSLWKTEPPRILPRLWVVLNDLINVRGAASAFQSCHFVLSTVYVCTQHSTQTWPRRAGAGVPASAISGGVRSLNAGITSLAKSRIDRFLLVGQAAEVERRAEDVELVVAQSRVDRGDYL